MPEPNPELEAVQSAEHETSLELNAEQKRHLGDIWIRVVLGTDEQPPENIADFSHDQLIGWMAASLDRESAKLFSEWALRGDPAVIDQIRSETNPEKRAELELRYIRDVHERFQKHLEPFQKIARSTKWDSWPQRISKTGDFNCVGATLLGEQALKEAGLKPMIGYPTGHVVNLTKLSNGELWYVDFMNSEHNIRRIQPTERQIAGQTVFEIDDDFLDYRLIIVKEPEQIVSAVLGNLSGMQHDAIDPNVPDGLEKQAAISQVQEFEHEISSVDIGGIDHSLFGKQHQIYQTPEWQREEKRIAGLWSDDDFRKTFAQTLTGPEQHALLRGLKEFSEAIRVYLLDESSALPAVDEPTGRFISGYRDALRELREKDSETYREMVEKMLKRVQSI